MPMKNAELPSLTGLRFLAAFSILFSHALTWCTPFNNTGIFHSAAALAGLCGMPLFFVLSGFVIHYNYASSFHTQPYAIATREFFAARFARIYPLYFFFFLFGAVSDFTANWISEAPRAFFNYIVHSASLTQSWVYKIVVNHRLLLDNGFGLGWSVSTEFFFYLAYVFFVFAVLRLRRPSGSLVVIAAYSAAVICGLHFAFRYSDTLMDFAHNHLRDFISSRENNAQSFYRYLFYYSPYVRIWEFVLGCLTAQLFLLMQNSAVTKSERRCGYFVMYTAVIFLAVFGVVYAFNLGNELINAEVHFFALNFGCAVPLATIIFCAARYRSPIASFLSLPWIVWLGDISYSIYAVHTWTLRPFIRPAVGLSAVTAIDAILRLTLSLAFTIMVATATYAIIEAPCRRYLRGKLMRREKKANIVKPELEPAAEQSSRQGI